MKSITIIILFMSFNLFGQTNYNTILNTKKDTLPQIDLHLKKSEQYSTIANILHASAVITLSALYYIDKRPIVMFTIPTGLVLSAFTFHIFSSVEYKKSKNYLESE